MKSSGIGGQAVIEGVMMKNKDVYSIAVRRPDGEIDVHLEDYRGIGGKSKLRKVPILRGVINFVDSLTLGMKCLTHSAKFYDEEEAAKPGLLERMFKDKAEDIVIGATVAFSIVLAVAVFMILPYFIANFLNIFIVSAPLLAVTEGLIRLLLFILYIVLISRMKDIQRVFRYHGAEHKCINCIENGWALNTRNVRKASRYHRRCGTSFLLVVMIISIIFFAFIRVDSPLLRVGIRLLLVPVIAGVSYEFIRLAGNSEKGIILWLSKPGLWLQGMTTKEPDRKMMEVAIAAVEAVFDWKAYQQEQGIVHEEEDPMLAEYGDDADEEEAEKSIEEAEESIEKEPETEESVEEESETEESAEEEPKAEDPVEEEPKAEDPVEEEPETEESAEETEGEAEDTEAPAEGEKETESEESAADEEKTEGEDDSPVQETEEEEEFGVEIKEILETKERGEGNKQG